MSKEAATAFIAKTHGDNELQQRVAEISSTATAEDFVNLAENYGFKFSQEDLIEAAKDDIESQGNQASELTDAELESVAGGKSQAGNLSSTCFRNL